MTLITPIQKDPMDKFNIIEDLGIKNESKPEKQLQTDEEPLSERALILREAEKLITGDRNVSYGTPTQNFTNIANLWTIRFGHLLGEEKEFTATDVADAMVLLKVARNIAGPKRDNFLDGAGYFACGYEAFLDGE